MSGPYIPHAPSRRPRIGRDAYKDLQRAGFTDDEISQKYEVVQEPGEGMRGLANAALQGVSFGFADEIAGLVGGDDVRDRMRASYERFSEDNPKTALAAEIAGSALTGGGAAAGLARAGVRGLGKTALARALASSAGVGAGTAGLAGFGAAEGDFGDRLPQALGSAAAGAVLGPAVGYATQKAAAPAARLVSSTLGGAAKVVPQLAPTAQKARDLATRVAGPKLAPADKARERAVAYADRMFQGSGQNLTDELSGLSQLAPDDPSFLLNRGGRSVQQAAKVAQSLSPEARDVIPARLGQQLEAGPSRLTKDLETAIGGPIPNPQVRLQELADDAATAARPLYDALRNVPLAGDDLTRVSQRPAVRDALEAARTNILNRGEGVPDGFTVGLMDDAKKVLDAQIESIEDAIEKGMAKGSDKARLQSLYSARDALVSQVDDLTNGAYAQARDVAGQGIRQREAFRAGTKYGTTSENKLRFEQGQRSPEELDRVLEGAAVNMDEIVGKTADRRNLAQRLFGSPAEREKLDLVTQHRPDAQAALRRGFRREDMLRKQATDALLPGQSQTTPLREAIDDFSGAAAGEVAGDLARFAAGTKTQKLLMAFAKVKARAAGLNEEAATELGRLLTLNRGASADEVQSYIRALQQMQARKALQGAQRRAAVRSVAPGVALSGGRNTP